MIYANFEGREVECLEMSIIIAADIGRATRFVFSRPIEIKIVSYIYIQKAETTIA